MKYKAVVCYLSGIARVNQFYEVPFADQGCTQSPPGVAPPAEGWCSFSRDSGGSSPLGVGLLSRQNKRTWVRQGRFGLDMRKDFCSGRADTGAGCPGVAVAGGD